MCTREIKAKSLVRHLALNMVNISICKIHEVRFKKPFYQELMLVLYFKKNHTKLIIERLSKICKNK